jgi:energy-coupling factor transport system substrate-specific component
MRRMAPLALILTSMAGALLFLWPFVGGRLPGASATTAVGLGTAAALIAVEVAARRLDVRLLALLAALAAIDAAARAVVVTGIGGFSPIFLLILCGGYVFGASYGFILGAVSLLVSALVTGGVGPWLPYQLFAVGWVGALSGLVGRHQKGRPTMKDVVAVTATGVIAGYGFGAAMDVWNWTFYQSSPGLGFHAGMALSTALEHFGRYYFATSLAYDSFRAGGNALLVGAVGLPVLVALARLRGRLHTEVESDPDPSCESEGVALFPEPVSELIGRSRRVAGPVRVIVDQPTGANALISRVRNKRL